MVRAKFVCFSVEKQVGCEIVRFRAVNSNDGKGNESWSKWTPSGDLAMTITNPDAMNKFQPGQIYFLDFTLEPPAQPTLPL